MNEEEKLPLLLKSIKKQTMQPHEVIVADAHSTDRTREIAHGFGARVVDGGLPSAGRNLGAEAATGEYILFLDADVELHDSEFLEQCMNEIKSRDLDFATCDVLPVDGNRYDYFSHQAYNIYCRLMEPVHQHAPGFCIFVRRSFHEDAGGFDESITFCEDHEYALRAAREGTFGYLSKPIMVSVRRFDRDGRANIAIKYILAELHFWFIGPIRSDMFKYTFGHKK